MMDLRRRRRKRRRRRRRTVFSEDKACMHDGDYRGPN